MAELPRLAAGRHVLLLFSLSQVAFASRKPVFFPLAGHQDRRDVGTCVDVGEKNLPKAGRFGEHNLPKEESAAIRR
jgi:hypothetical protein